MSQRRKLTKQERSLLYYASDGKCQICGCELPDNWHADHVVPFMVSGKTNIHEMQALCPDCNLKKGIMMLRKHQLEMTDLCDQIRAGAPIKEIIASITPGGGKSALPVILSARLIPHKADCICWIVPRDNLRSQGEREFTASWLRMILGHNHLIRQSINDINPSRNLQGHITTYQAVVSNPRILHQEFARKRYILFLDEPHHIAAGSPYERAIQPLIDQAVLTVFASGTLERGDNKKIAFLPYKQTPLGPVVDLEQIEHRKVINYSLTDALDEGEKAIVPLEFEIHDGRAEWIDQEGQEQIADSFNDYTIDARSALNTALKTSFAHELIDKCLEHWKGHKKYVYHPAKMLIVAPNIEVAKQYLAYLKQLGISGAIATSKDDKEAKRNIDRFRKNLDVLVTVAMAYEGLSVIEITHIACLTNIRSKPWLEQCFARANRISKNKGQGFIFAPDDPDFRNVMETIRLQQLAAVRDDDGDRIERKSGDEENELKGSILPQASQLTNSSAYSLKNGQHVSSEQYDIIQRAAENADIPTGLVPIPKLNQFLIEAGLQSLHNHDQEINFNAPLVTPTEQENNLKTSIETYCRRVDRSVHNCQWGTTNKEVYGVFGKPRQEMTIQELQQVWRFLQHNYPLDGEDYAPVAIS